MEARRQYREPATEALWTDSSPPPRRPVLRGSAMYRISAGAVSSHGTSSAESSTMEATRRSHTSPFSRDTPSHAPTVPEVPGGRRQEIAACSTSTSTPIAQQPVHRSATHLDPLVPMLARRWTRSQLGAVFAVLRRLRVDAELRLRTTVMARWVRWAARQKAVRALYELVGLPQCEVVAQSYFRRWRRAVEHRRDQHTSRALRARAFDRWLARFVSASACRAFEHAQGARHAARLLRHWRQRASERRLAATLACVRLAAESRLAERFFLRWMLWTLSPGLVTALLEHTARHCATRVFRLWRRTTQLRLLTVTTCSDQSRRYLSRWSLWAVRQRQARQLALENAVRHARLAWRRWLLDHRRRAQRRRSMQTVQDDRSKNKGM